MPAVDGKEMQPPKPPGQHAVTVLWSFGKFLATLLPVYLAGYFGFSISLVLFGLMVYIGWKHSRNEKVMRLRSAMFVLENERAYTTARAFMSKQELPPWVNFPDVEKVEWMNQILQQAWPFVGQYLEKLLVETITPAIRASNTHLQSLSFTTVNLGEKVLTRALVVGVKAHTEHDKRQVLLDLYISYAGDVEINVEIKKYFCKAGVKGIQLHGKLRVILEPLIGDVPLVGAITMFFIRRPKLDINWTGLTNMLDIPGLNAMSDTMIMDAIASYLVLPNRLTIPLVADLHVAQLRSPLPRGVVRIHLLEAEELTAKDTVIKGIIDGKSDPYAVLRVGTQTFTSHTVDSNLNPQWREMFEVIVHEVPGQELEVEVFDKDQNQDDFLGRVKMDLDVVHKARVVDEVTVSFCLQTLISSYLFCFDQVHHIHIPETLLSVSPCDQVIQRNRNMTCKTGDPPSAAILSVYLDRAQDLPVSTDCGHICYLTSDPVWEDAFTFYIQDPRKQELYIHVKDDDRALSLGSLSIPLTRLLASPDLSMDQWFQLDNSGRIYINAVLRVLHLNEDASLTSSVSPHLPSPGAGHGDGGTTSEVALRGVGGAPKPEPTRPQQTTPDSDFASEGVLRIHLAEASNLIAKDNFIGGMVKGKSDPYVKIRVAGVTFRSHTIKENLNPSWNELYEIILTQLPGQEIQFELFDKDLDQDDFLGSFPCSLPPSPPLSLSLSPPLSFLLSPSPSLLFSPSLSLSLSLFSPYSFPSLCLSFSPSPSLPPLSVPSPIFSISLPLSPLSLPSPFLHISLSPLPFSISLSHLNPFFPSLLSPSSLFTSRGLPACGSAKDSSDPYVSFILLPDKNRTTKRKTITKKRDLNPEFNERFDFDFTLEECMQRRLDLTVKNNVSFMSRERELIGKVLFV
uniref:Extended synaptotagmin-like protein 1a n=1 Tax=Oncorhynchus tshawytscha TaxID=74940 RepID=A0A8C8H4Y3_ONCTS